MAVIARVPFDEGSLTAALTPGTTFPEGDWRITCFKPGNLAATLAADPVLGPRPSAAASREPHAASVDLC